MQESVCPIFGYLALPGLAMVLEGAVQYWTRRTIGGHNSAPPGLLVHRDATDEFPVLGDIGSGPTPMAPGPQEVAASDVADNE